MATSGRRRGKWVHQAAGGVIRLQKGQVGSSGCRMGKWVHQGAGGPTE